MDGGQEGVWISVDRRDGIVSRPDWQGALARARLPPPARRRNIPAGPMAKRRKSKTTSAVPRPRRAAAPRRTRAGGAAEPLDLRRCERFVMHEARLLDDARFDEW